MKSKAKRNFRKITGFMLALTMVFGMSAITVPTASAAAATAAQVSVATPPGSSGSPAPIDLTGGGYDDWAHFGLAAVSDINRKAGVTDRLIGSPATMDTTALQVASATDVTQYWMQFNWTDGAPTAAAGTTSFVKASSPGAGIKLGFTLPAGNYELTVYGSAYNEYVDAVVTGQDGTELARQAMVEAASPTPTQWQLLGRVVTVEYSSDTAQTVYVAFARQSDYQQYGGISMAAATVKKLTKAAVSASVANISSSSAFSLDNPAYSEWAHYGESSTIAAGTAQADPAKTKKAASTTNIVGAITATNGKFTREQGAGASIVPAFSWTGGTPVASAAQDQWYSWTGSNGSVSQQLNFPAGNYRASVYLIGLRVTADLSVTGSVSGDIFDQAGLYTKPAAWTDSRQCELVTINCNSDTAQTVTVALNVSDNNSGSVAVQAITIEDLSPVQSYAVTASASPSTGGTVTGAGAYAEGAAVKMTAAANSGFTFKEWQVASGSLTLADPAAASLSFTMPGGNVDLRAVFTRNTGLLNLTQYINMRVGTSGASNTLIGTQRPNSSASPGPDTTPQNGNTGYNPTGQIIGFSQIHVSGTGVGKYGQFLVSPQTGLSTRLDSHASAFTNETPTCSEYSVNLSKYNITASFTPAEHSAIYKFVYPQSDQSSVVLDVVHNIGNGTPTNLIVNTGTDENGMPFISGSGNYPGGWGSAHNLYFYAVLEKPGAALGLFNASGNVAGTSMGPFTGDLTAGGGAYATFATAAGDTVYFKIATSFTSIGQAKTWLGAEIPAWDYETVRATTDDLWNQELNKIVVDGNISSTNLQIFYTAIYHAHIMPRDRTGDIVKFGSADMIDDHFCIWDTWRTLYPLYAITNPDLVTKTVNSFITRYKSLGYVKDSFVAGVDMNEQQGGDNIDNVIADAYVKGIPGVNWNDAYAVVKNDADNYRLSFTGFGGPYRTPNVNAEYKTLGYISTSTPLINCSYTLEYAYNDFCAAEIAKGLGQTADYQKYLARSNNWTNIWNPNLVNNGYTGFINPRAAGFGAFAAITPTQDMGSWNNYFYEASSWGYSFFVPHDVSQLIDKMGGQDTFDNRLQLGVKNGWVDFGNEPAFLAAALFNDTNKPWMTSDAMATVRAKYSLSGVPGNDDSGAMSSWYIFSSTGFFPNSGQDIYYITSPIFEQTTFNLDNGKQFQIIAHNLSSVNKYIQSVTVNGKPYYSTTFTHDIIVSGGTIVYEMGPTPVNYAKAPANKVSVTHQSGQTAGGFGVNLSWYPEGAQFASAGVTNRTAGIANPVIGDISAIGPNGLSSVASSPTASITSTINNGPQISSYTAGDGGIVLPLNIPAGSTDVTIYFFGPSTSIEVYDSGGNKAAEATAGYNANLITLSFDCETSDVYSVKLINADGISCAYIQNIASHVVTFNSNGADDVPNQVVRDGGFVAQPGALTRNGYVFGGWYSDSAFTSPWNFANDKVTADITLFAKWIPLFSVTFVANGGSAVSAQTIAQGSLVSAVTPTRTGYSFGGWFTNAALTGTAWNFATDTVQGNMTLYAQWTQLPAASIISVTPITAANNVNLTQFDDWAAFGPADSTVQWTARKNITSPIIGGLSNVGGYWINENVTPSPQTFSWSDGTPVAAGTGDQYAVWSSQGLNLAFNVPAGGFTANIYVTGIRAGAYVQILDGAGAVVDTKPLWGNTAETRMYGVVSVGFYCVTAQKYTVRLMVDTANAQPANYSVGAFAATVSQVAPGVTVTSGGNGSVSGSGIYETGSTVTITATADPGYVFKGWQVTGGAVTVPNTATATFTMPDKSVALTATFGVQTVWVRSLDNIANLTHITLSQPQYYDWAYLGYSSGPIRYANSASRVFSSNISAVSGGLTQEDMATYNSGSSPYFTWAGGTPTATGTDIRFILWNAAGLSLNVSIPAGLYETGLYISGVRAACDLQVIDSSGATVLTQHLWDDPGSTRPYKLLNLDFDCKTPQTYTIKMLTNPAAGAANYSVSIFAGFATKLADYTTNASVTASGGTATATYNVYNAGAAGMNVKCILAVYDPNGSLCDIKTTAPSAPAGASVYTLTAPLTAGYTAKAFIWDDAYAPLCAAAVYK